MDLKDTTSSWCKRVNCCSLNFWHLKGPQSLGDPSDPGFKKLTPTAWLKLKWAFWKNLEANWSQLSGGCQWARGKNMKVAGKKAFVFLTQNSYSFTVLLVQLHPVSPPLFPSLYSASVLPTVSISLPSLLLSPLPSLCLNSSLLGVWPGSPGDTFRLWDSVPYQMRPLLKSSRFAVPLREPLSLVHLL